MLVPSGRVVTAGAAVGHLDLVLWLIRQAVLGKSPLAYFQDLRVERANSLVQASNLDLEAIAAELGYLDGATLGTLLRQRLRRGVRELRADLL